MVKVVAEALQTIAHTAVPDVAADADAHAAEKDRIDDEFRRQVRAVFLLEPVDDLGRRFRRQLRRALDRGVSLLDLETKQALGNFRGRE